MKKIILLIILGLSLFNLSHAVTTRPLDNSGMSTEDKIELIKDVKKFIHDFEQDNQLHNLTLQDQKKFFLNFLISEAWANDSFDCFYGGWPSHLQTVGEKKYCTNPKKSDLYHQSNCKPNELACEPILFGGGICAPFSSKTEKLSAFSNCEKKFESKPEADKYKFVKNLAGEELNKLKIYLELVSKICNVNKQNYKTVSYNCKKINDKISKFYSQNSPKKDHLNLISSSTKKNESTDCPTCENNELPILPSGNLHEISESLNKVPSSSAKTAYDALKKDYINSGMCNPIYNYTGDDKIVLLMNAISAKTSAFYPWFDKDYNSEFISNSFEKLMKAIDYSKEEKSDLENEFRILQTHKFYLNHPDVNEKYRLREPYYKQAKKLVAKIKAYAYKATQRNSNSGEKIILEKMATKKMVKLLPSGEIDCAFIDFTTFEKAYKGFGQLKNTLKKPIMSIVDYTMPSNSRRMFVLDLEKNMVLHNTWVAHGNGPENDQDKGNDGWGAIPRTSNKSGTNLSSHGFIRTAENYNGEYGKSIRLIGIDKENTNIRSRAIVIHPWESQPIVSTDQESIQEKLDNLKNNNFEDERLNNSMAESFRGLRESDYIPATWGCLGITDRLAPDRISKKNLSQVDLLRRDISGGSLIFNYIGPDQTSKFF